MQGMWHAYSHFIGGKRPPLLNLHVHRLHFGGLLLIVLSVDSHIIPLLFCYS